MASKRRSSARRTSSVSGMVGDLLDLPEGADAALVALRQLVDVLVGERDGVAVRLVDGDLVVGQRRQRLLARHGRGDVRGELLALLTLPLGLALVELRHDLGREQLERLADVLVPVLAALLDEDGLVDTGLLEYAQGTAQVVGRADAAHAAAERVGPELLAHLQEGVPDVRAAGRVLAEDVVVGERVLEEPEAVGPASLG